MKHKVIKFSLLALILSGAGCVKNMSGVQPSKLTQGFSPQLSASGIGGYALTSPQDRAIAYDYDGSGKNDHILLYRSGSKLVSIMKYSNNAFSPVFTSSNGIGGYDMAQGAPSPDYLPFDLGFDQIVPFDYYHNGSAQQLICYRPGSSLLWIVDKDINGNFYSLVPNLTGVGNYVINYPQDKIVPFDFSHSGKMDYLLVYRPSKKAVYIYRHDSGNTFTQVFGSGSGIGGYNMDNINDQIIPFDYSGTGKMDYLVCYRPGGSAMYILQNNNGVFTPVFTTTSGLPGVDLSHPQDRYFAYDYYGTGKRNTLFGYTPGNNIYNVLSFSGSTVTQVTQGTKQTIGYPFSINPTVTTGYSGDHAFAMDLGSQPAMSSLCMYAPGVSLNLISVVNNNSGIFSTIL